MSRLARTCIAILLVAAAIRLATLGAYPLADTTEARYSEIARLMLVSGDWITPQIEVDVPFWAKPPLSTWLTAASFKAFGVSEFSARLPVFLLLLGCVWVVVSFGRTTHDLTTGLAAGAIILTSGLGFVSAGAVMTDPALLLSTTFVMVAFWRAVIGRQTQWGYVFFVALALGLLAKGPVAWVLSLVPIVAWVLWRRQWRAVRRQLPWGLGLALIVVIAVPWYLAAEMKTPGFLNYFLVGEHWLRFVDSGWTGDLYGTGNAEPRGMIWPFWLGSVFPWSLVALLVFIRWRRDESRPALSDWHRYLILWAVTPMVFFSFAGNILPAYVLPGVPAFALLLARPLVVRNSSLLHAAWIIPILFVVLGPLVIYERLADRSQHDLIQYVQNRTDVERLVYLYKRPYSANFYSAGKAAIATSPEEVGRLLDRPGRDYVVAKLNHRNDLPRSLQERLDVVRGYSRFVLMVQSAADSD